MQKRLTKLLLIFIILHPFFDILATYLKLDNFSLATITRPIIPVIVFIYIFIKEINWRSKMIFIGTIYFVYAAIHLLIFNYLATPWSAGNILAEARYLFNYTYIVALLFILIYFFNKNNKKELIKATLIMIALYISLCFLALITNTAMTTYTEGFGFKGYFNTGGSLGTILLVGITIIIANIKSLKKNYFVYLVILASAIYLLFFLGTRTALYGLVILLGYVIFTLIYLKIIKPLNVKKQILILLVIFVLGITSISVLLNIKTERNQYLNNLGDKYHNPITKESLNITLDLFKDLTNSNITMRKDQYYALLKLYNYSEETNLLSTDLRKQQLIYHEYLWHESNSINEKLFGNGYLTNSYQVTLEMEFHALLYNFGIFGFLLYLGPFLAIFLLTAINYIKKYQYLNFEVLIYLGAAMLSYALAFLSGHIFFNAATIIIIAITHTLIWQKNKEIKEVISNEKSFASNN